MDHLADAEEQMVTEIMRQKLNEITAATEAQLSGVKDHVNFTLQQAYFKCAYECFDRSKTQEEIGNCVEYCSVPVLKAHYLVEDETAKFAIILLECCLSKQLRFTRVTKLSCSQPLSFLCALVADSKSFRWNTLELREDSYILCFKRFLEHHLHPPTKENMKRSLTLCQDKFVAAKLQQDGNAIKVLESCVDLSTQHCLKTLPYLVRQLKTSLGITE
nr:protein FAM136A-like [Ipomoea batatas]